MNTHRYTVALPVQENKYEIRVKTDNRILQQFLTIIHSAFLKFPVNIFS